MSSSYMQPASYPGCTPGPEVQLWAYRHGTDAMFLALLQLG